MKKLFMVTLLAGGITAITSCKKEFTCQCTVFGFTDDTTLVDVSKSEAKDYCDDQDAGLTLFGGSCELK